MEGIALDGPGRGEGFAGWWKVIRSLRAHVEEISPFQIWSMGIGIVVGERLRAGQHSGLEQGIKGGRVDKARGFALVGHGSLGVRDHPRNMQARRFRIKEDSNHRMESRAQRDSSGQQFPAQPVVASSA